MNNRTARRGFTLLVVLWTVAGIAAAALTIRLAAMSTLGSAQADVSATRAFWMAESCIARTMASVDAALQSTSADANTGRPWSSSLGSVPYVAYWSTVPNRL